MVHTVLALSDIGQHRIALDAESSHPIFVSQAGSMVKGHFFVGLQSSAFMERQFFCVGFVVVVSQSSGASNVATVQLFLVPGQVRVSVNLGDPCTSPMTSILSSRSSGVIYFMYALIVF